MVETNIENQKTGTLRIGRQHRSNLTLMLGTAIVSATVSAPALAQESSGYAGIDSENVIVVTARQRAEDVQEVPISISTIGGDALVEGRIDTLQEIEYAVPNLVFGETGTSGETHIGLRGIGDFSRNVGFDTRVGVYIDGIFAGQSLAVDQGLVDIAQIEVLRGPQGTLFGKNSSSGVVNIITQKPKLGELSGSVQIGGGNLDTIYGSAILNVPLGENAAGRFSLVAQNQDGYEKNLTTGKDLLSNDHLLGRGRILIEPTDSLEIILSGDFRKQDNDILFLEPEPDVNAPGRFAVAQDGPLIDENRGFGFGLEANYTFGNGYKLTSITGYREAKRKVGSDEDASPDYGLHIKFFNDKFEHFTQEIRLASPGENPFRFVVGGYFFHQEGSQLREGYFGPGFGAPADTLAARGSASVDTTAWAGFINANLDLTDTLTLTGGIRYTNEKKDASVDQFGSPAGLADFTGFTDSLNDDSVTATASLQYQATDNLLVYASYDRGYKSGGFNVDFVGSTGEIPFDSETVDSFEAGFKSDLWDNRLRFNVSAFYAEYSNFQVFQFQTVGGNTLLIASNAASVTTQGIEVEGFVRLTDNFEISYGLGYVDAEFDDFPGGATDDLGVPINIAGNSLPRAPKVSGSVTGRYKFPIGGSADGTFSVTYSHRGEQFFNPDNRDRTRQGAYGLLNASLDIELNDRWTIGIWGRNLTDEVFRTNRGVSFLGIPFSLYGQPRTYGAEVRVNF